MFTLKSTLALAALATITVSCISNEEHRRALDANRALRTQLAELTNYHQQLSGANARLTEQVERLGKSAADAQWIKEQKEKLARLQGALTDIEGQYRLDSRGLGGPEPNRGGTAKRQAGTERRDAAPGFRIPETARGRRHRWRPGRQ